MNIFDNNPQFIYTSFFLFFIYYGNIIYIKNSVTINREAFKFGKYLYNFLSEYHFYINSHLYVDESDDSDDDEITNDTNQKIIVPEPKYEDKYLSEIRNMNKEFIFSEEEKELEVDKIIKFFNKLKDDLNEQKSENEKNNHESNKSLSWRTGLRGDIINADITMKAKDHARQFVIEKRLEKLKDCFVMEKTPMGYVLMKYNVSRNSFHYYCDNIIPYKYLESVSRKFVKFFNCRPIYYDMEEELKNYEIKLEREEREREEREKEEELKKEIERCENGEKGEMDKIPKKNVFAKFKSYNKESGTGRVNTGVPPKNSIPCKQLTQSNSTAKILLKENANRYTCEGKLSNFNILKKVDKKLVDKKLTLTFADFKKQQLEIKK